MNAFTVRGLGASGSMAIDCYGHPIGGRVFRPDPLIPKGNFVFRQMTPDLTPGDPLQ
jgi:hypothetical protein